MNNIVMWILLLSISFQLLAAYYALQLIRITGRSLAWLSVASAVMLMAIRRSITLSRLFIGDLARPPDISAELVALTISALIMLRIRSMSPLFDSIRAGEKIQEGYVKREKFISEIGNLALSNPDLSKLFRETVKILSKILGVKFSDILMIQEGSKELLLISGVGWKRGLVGKKLISTNDNSQINYIIKQRNPIVTEKLDTETRFQVSEYLANHQIISSMSVVVGDLDNPYGLVGVHANEYHNFNSADADFLQSIANILGEAIRRKDAEELQSSNQFKYQALFDHVNDAVFLIGLDQIYVAANQQAADMLGYSVNEIVEMSVNQLIAPSDTADSTQVFLDISQGKKLPIYERIAIAKNGDKIPIEVDVTLVYGPNGEPQHIQSVVRDIRGRKQKERENELLLIREREERLQAETLAESTLAISSKLNTSEVLDEILKQVNRIVPYDGAQIGLIEDNIIKNVHWVGYDIHGGAEVITNLEQKYKNLSIDNRTIKTKQPQVIEITSEYLGWVVEKETA